MSSMELCVEERGDGPWRCVRWRRGGREAQVGLGMWTIGGVCRGEIGSPHETSVSLECRVCLFSVSCGSTYPNG